MTLTKCKVKAPTNAEVFSNKINGTITLTTPLGVDSSNYAKYREELTNTLIETIGTELAYYLPFQRTPSDVDVLIHVVNLLTIPDNNEDLSNEVIKACKMSDKIDVISTKYLKPDERLRPGAKAASIILRVPEQGVAKLVPSVLLMGKFKESAIM